jgi:Domain of unknown function (DUF4265)
MSANKLARLTVSLRKYDTKRGQWPPFDEEKLWAEQVSSGRFRIDNVPFYARNVSYDDIVVADEMGNCRAREVVERGKHSTFRIMFASDLSTLRQEQLNAEYAQYFEALREIGCASPEFAGPGLVAIDVLPYAIIEAITDVLEIGVEEGRWDYEWGYIYRSDDADLACY